MKMYGGGMGDQIKRYCEKMEPEEYEDILDNEARVAEGEVFDSDPNCFSTKDRGREVKVCRSDKSQLYRIRITKLYLYSDAPLTSVILASKVWRPHLGK